MGIKDWFKRSGRPSGDWVDPSEVDPEEALRIAEQGLAGTDTYIDEHGRRRKLPPGGKDPVAEALRKAREQTGREDGGDV
jgi:hypothetical protein